MFQNPKNVATKFTRNWLIVKFLQEFIELYTFLDIYILKKKVTLITWFFRTSFVHPFILLIYYKSTQNFQIQFKKKKKKEVKSNQKTQPPNVLKRLVSMISVYLKIIELKSISNHTNDIDLPKFVLVLIGFFGDDNIN